MRFKIEQQELVKALTSICKITAKSTKKTVLENVHILKLDDNKIRLEAFNGITILQYDLIAESVEGEEILFNANYLLSIVSRLNDTIQFDNGYIRAGKCQYKIPFIKDEFPKLNIKFDENEISVNTKNFINAISKTLYSTATVGNGPLTGIYLNKNDVVSTDSNRLTITKIDSELPNFILPKELCENIIKLFASEEIKIFIDDKNIIIHNDNIYISNSSVIGKYPNYEAILPREFKHELKFNKADLLNALNILTPILQQLPSMLCTIKFSDRTCEVRAKSNDSESLIDFEIETRTIEPIELNFNGQFLLDMLKNHKEYITIKINGNINPVVFTEDDLYSLIMPIVTRY